MWVSREDTVVVLIIQRVLRAKEILQGPFRPGLKLVYPTGAMQNSLSRGKALAKNLNIRITFLIRILAQSTWALLLQILCFCVVSMYLEPFSIPSLPPRPQML